MTKSLLALITAFTVCAIIMPFIIKLTKKLKLRQTVLNYVDNHAGKTGTPTMGGVGFVLVSSVLCFLYSSGSNSLMAMTAILTLCFGIIGFIDDFIKVYFHRNEGLTARQKLLFQIAVSLIIAFFVYNNSLVGDKLYLPFTMNEISLGYFAVPFYALVFIAMSNGVNLTDGLDALASKTAIAYTVFFTAILAVIVYGVGVSEIVSQEYSNLIIFCLVLIGSLCAFLLFNGYPANIFMGDTGSLALGGALAGLAVMSKMSLTAPIIGAIYVFTCLSDIIQVIHFKRTGKRVFKMAPFHHHLERVGLHENKIVTIYTLTTFFFGALTLLITVSIF